MKQNAALVVVETVIAKKEIRKQSSHLKARRRQKRKEGREGLKRNRERITR